MSKQPTLAEIQAMMEDAAKLNETGQMYTFQPVPKQKEFMAAGSKYRIRYLRAGNQNGKTLTASREMAYHLTGIYPKWWRGKKFGKAVRAWACGDGAMLVRDTIQKLLCGDPTGSEDDLGTGAIPKECFTRKPTLSHGITNAFDTVYVKHASGGISSLTFKSYDQGRRKFQAEGVDIIWLDEEPDEAIFDECLTRTMATKGIVMVTFTPLQGETALVKRLMAADGVSAYEVSMTIYDAEWYTEEERERIIAGWPEHQRKARALGLPFLGDNAVFEEVTKEQIQMPLRLVGGVVSHRDLGQLDTSHWAKLWGIDFGIGHSFAAVLCAWNKDDDIFMVLGGIKVAGKLPVAHAEAMKRIAADAPVAWPHDGHARDKGSGIQLIKHYKAAGLKCLPSHACFPDGGYSTEAGIREMLVRMRSERFGVAEGFQEWWEEFFGYYRKDGLIVKKNDDLMSATRMAVMQMRSARQVGLGMRGPGTVESRAGYKQYADTRDMFGES